MVDVSAGLGVSVGLGEAVERGDAVAVRLGLGDGLEVTEEERVDRTISSRCLHEVRRVPPRAKIMRTIDVFFI